MTEINVSSSAIRRVFTATLIMGQTGAGKTSLAETFAVYLWETYKKILLLYSWDGGAIPTGVQVRMKQNLIRFWRCRTRSGEGLGLDTCYFATKGHWPRTIDPITGEVPPTVALVPPLTTKYLVRCPNDHDLITLPNVDLVQPMLCSVCKQMIGRDQLHVEESILRTRGFEDVGGVFFDGLTSMSGIALEHMDHARGAGQVGGERSAFGGNVVSGNAKWGGNNRADIGFGQTRAQEFVHNSLQIPGLVEGPVFTALTKEATDEGGLSIIGLNLPGNAATDAGAAWFGNVMEAGRQKDDAGHEHFALYLRPFVDQQNRRHLLKTSASPTGVPDALIDPIGAPFSVVNLGNVFRLLDEDLRVKLMETGPTGVPAAPTSYGEEKPFGVVSAATPVPPSSGMGLPVTAAPKVETVAPAGRPMPVVPVVRPSQQVRPPTPAETATAVMTAGVVTAVAPPPGMKPPKRLSTEKSST